MGGGGAGYGHQRKSNFQGGLVRKALENDLLKTPRTLTRLQ